MKMDALIKTEMHSGHLCLNLSSRIGWDEFPDFVQELLRCIGGQVIEKNDAVDLRVWNVDFGGEVIRIVWDDFPLMVSIESPSSSGDQKINEIFDILNR